MTGDMNFFPEASSFQSQTVDSLLAACNESKQGEGIYITQKGFKSMSEAEAKGYGEKVTLLTKNLLLDYLETHQDYRLDETKIFHLTEHTEQEADIQAIVKGLFGESSKVDRESDIANSIQEIRREIENEERELEAIRQQNMKISDDIAVCIEEPVTNETLDQLINVTRDSEKAYQRSDQVKRKLNNLSKRLKQIHSEIEKEEGEGNIQIPPELQALSEKIKALLTDQNQVKESLLANDPRELAYNANGALKARKNFSEKRMVRHRNGLQKYANNFNSHQLETGERFIKERIDELTDLRDHLSNMQKRWPELDYTPQEELVTQIESHINTLQENYRALKELCPPEKFHMRCSEGRAAVLLKRQPLGTFLLRESSRPKSITLSLVREKNGETGVSEVELQITNEGRLLLGEKEYKSVEEVVRSLTKSEPRALPNAPIDHLIAQFEWNVTDEPPETTLKDKEAGSVCITRGKSENEYVLYILEEDSETGTNMIRQEVVMIRDGKARVNKGEQTSEANSLRDLLQLGLDINNYRIIHSSPASTIEEVFYQKVLPTLQESGKEWAKLSRKTHKFLHRSVFVSREGEIYEQIHRRMNGSIRSVLKLDEKEGFRGKGTYKKIWDITPFYPISSLPNLVRGRWIELDPEVEAPYENMEKMSLEFLRELKKELGDHPYLLIPTILSYPRINDKGTDRHVLIMPLMKGDLKKEKSSLSPIGRLRAAQQIAQGLAAMHEKGFVHLDIKPANVMLEHGEDESDPHVRITDFDFSRKVNEEEKVHRVGSPMYADPAIFDSQRDIAGLERLAAADQFSWGMILYEFLCGKYPERTGETIYRGDLIDEELLEQNQEYRELSPELKEILIDCLVGENESRTPQMTEIAQRLGAYIQHLEKDQAR